MKISQHLHHRLRIKNGLLTIIILSLLITLAWLSRLYSTQIDLSANASNTLSETSQKILTTLPDPISITAYIKQPALQKQVIQLIDKYRRFKNNIHVSVIDPDSAPDKARELNIGPQGVIVVEYQGRNKKITFLDETSLSNTLLQLASTNKRWITFITGHGEPSPAGNANFDIGLFAKQLADHKINSQALNLAQLSAIPDNSSLLVLISPRVALLPGELNIISEYIDNGGNLLLLTDPKNHHLKPIEQHLGIKKLPGTIVDSSSGLYGIDDPTFVLVSEYTRHPVTLNFSNITVFPVTAALELADEGEFETKAILTSVLHSWTETGDIIGKVRFDADSEEQEGPLTLGYTLTKHLSGKNQQRIAVIGDSDFLSNAFLGNVGNSELGFRLINWLTHDDKFIEIPITKSAGKSLQLSNTAIAIIGFGFLIILPLILFIIGFIIWRRRKRR